VALRKAARADENRSVGETQSEHASPAASGPGDRPVSGGGQARGAD